jgi:hypothetical protein
MLMYFLICLKESVYIHEPGDTFFFQPSYIQGSYKRLESDL